MLNAKRQQKIERYKQQKETERQLKELKPLLEKEHIDEEVKVSRYILIFVSCHYLISISLHLE